MRLQMHIDLFLLGYVWNSNGALCDVHVITLIITMMTARLVRLGQFSVPGPEA